MEIFTVVGPEPLVEDWPQLAKLTKATKASIQTIFFIFFSFFIYSFIPVVAIPWTKYF